LYHGRKEMTKKTELLKEAKKLKIDVSDKNTVAEIEKALKTADTSMNAEEKVDLTKAAIDSAEQQATVIAEKRSTELVADQKNRSAKPLAKAGRRSEKGLKEAEEKQEKIEHQKHREETADDSESKPKQPVKPTRSRLERRGKKYREAAKSIDRDKLYGLTEAIDLAIKSATTKFDSTVELHVRLNVDPKQADQNVRDNVVLPAGTGKTIRVAVLADEDDSKKALKAGADKAGGDDLLAEIAKEQLDFDVLIATPNMMVKLAKHARVLGPRGLMPNPKSGTVTADVAKAVEQSKAGKIEYRVDSTGIIHIGAGKVSFGTQKLQTNLDAVISSIKQNKPASIKSSFINSAYLTTTMGPSVKLQI
jgi:ribosomal protein L1